MRIPLGPVSLLAVALAFLLPFVEMSCQKKPVITLNGYETAFGKEVEARMPLGPLIDLGQQGGRRRDTHFSVTVNDHVRTEARPMVAAALIVSVLAGLVAFKARAAGAVGGLAVVVVLLVAQTRMNQELQEPPQIPLPLTLSFLPGFWIALACAAAGGILCLLESRRPPATTSAG